MHVTMKKPAVIGFYGESKTGKTTLIIEIIKRLTNEGLKVATVKITDKNIGIDTEGKDTWKYSKAGSELVVFSSPIETDFIHAKSNTISKIINNIKKMDEFDIIIVEGAHDKNIPKIRIGDIKERENTIFTYNRDFDGLIEMIKNEFIGGKK
jgi:molybdopterin-guanine dinucleotide biosynthesis protein B